MTDDIEQAAQALIVAIEAAVHRVPRDYDAEQQFYAAYREIQDRISGAAYEVIGRRTREERERAYEIENQRKRAKQREERRQRKAQAEAKAEAEVLAAQHKLEKIRAKKARAPDLKAQLFKAHPDHGGSNEAFRAAYRRYRAAKP